MFLAGASVTDSSINKRRFFAGTLFIERPAETGETVGNKIAEAESNEGGDLRAGPSPLWEIGAGRQLGTWRPRGESGAWKGIPT